MPWFDIGELDDFPAETSRERVVGDRIVAVCHTEGEIYALDGICPHQGGPLGKGSVEGCVLTCPWHGWQYDVRDGQSLLSPHVRHQTIPVKLASGRVWVELDSGP